MMVNAVSGELRPFLVAPNTEEFRGRSADLSAGRTCVSGSDMRWRKTCCFGGEDDRERVKGDDSIAQHWSAEMTTVGGKPMFRRPRASWREGKSERTE